MLNGGIGVLNGGPCQNEAPIPAKSAQIIIFLQHFRASRSSEAFEAFEAFELDRSGNATFGAEPTLGSPRAGGQDYGSLNKLPQTSLVDGLKDKTNCENSDPK